MPFDARATSGADAIGDPVEHLAIRLEIALGVVPRADQERCMVQREVLPRHHLAEPGQTRARFHSARDYHSTRVTRIVSRRYAKMSPSMAEEPRPGLIVGGRYELIEIAGRGGMADVWRGRVRGDWGFVRDVAVKQMHQNLASQPPYVAMFVEEARLGSMLQSPNVAEVHDFVHDRGNYYMILEWIDGVDLGTLDPLARRPERADAVGARRSRRGRNSSRSRRGARAHRPRRLGRCRSSIATCRRTTCC